MFTRPTGVVPVFAVQAFTILRPSRYRSQVPEAPTVPQSSMLCQPLPRAEPDQNCRFETSDLTYRMPAGVREDPHDRAVGRRPQHEQGHEVRVERRGVHVRAHAHRGERAGEVLVGEGGLGRHRCTRARCCHPAGRVIDREPRRPGPLREVVAREVIGEGHRGRGHRRSDPTTGSSGSACSG